MPPSEDELRASWQAKVRHYDDLLQYVGWEHLRPFREVVVAVAASEWAGRLLASSSHERLVVVAPGRWPIRHVCVVPATDGQAHIPRRESVNETDCGRVPMESLYQAIQQHFEWLVSNPRRTKRCT
jgi:hypothetical protein